MCMCIYVHICNCVHILNQKTKQMSSRGASPLKKWHLMHVCGNSRSIIDFKHFLKMYNYILPNNVLEADKAKIKGHLLNEIRFSETAPRNPIVVSPAFCLPAFCFLLLGDEAVSLRRRKRICILFLLSHIRPGTPVSVTGHRDSWDWQACKLMEIRLRRNQCNL